MELNHENVSTHFYIDVVVYLFSFFLLIFSFILAEYNVRIQWTHTHTHTRYYILTQMNVIQIYSDTNKYMHAEFADEY